MTGTGPASDTHAHTHAYMHAERDRERQRERERERERERQTDRQREREKETIWVVYGKHTLLNFCMDFFSETRHTDTTFFCRRSSRYQGPPQQESQTPAGEKNYKPKRGQNGNWCNLNWSYFPHPKGWKERWRERREGIRIGSTWMKFWQKRKKQRSAKKNSHFLPFQLSSQRMFPIPSIFCNQFLRNRLHKP